MDIHFIYRSSPEKPQDPSRPSYFDKRICLESFLRAVHALNIKAKITFINDGEIAHSILELMKKNGKVINKRNLGNIGSLKIALNYVQAQNWPEEDLVYFSEDDYLYLKNAFTKLHEAVQQLGHIDYFTLYDHPDRYRRTDDADGGRVNIYLSESHHWRAHESTCQTYGVRLSALNRDRWIINMAMLPKNTPRGREMFRAIQGLGKYKLKFPKHTLAGPIPGLATHVVKSCLAPLVDWESEARDISEYSPK